MKKIILMSLIFFSSLNYFFAHAQAKDTDVTISGKVTSFEESLGLEGVSINVKGTNNNTGTQADGTFTIVVSPENKTLVVKLAGYQTEEITISTQKTYDIVLKREENIEAFSKSSVYADRP
jgi:TonB-dependent starch-binding outer membrane protein SusC